MKNTGLALGLTLSMLVCTPSFCIEPTDAPATRPAAQSKSVDPIAELRNQDTAFSLLMEAFRQIQGRIIQNDYEARIKAAHALSDLKTRRYVAELAKEERDLRVEKLYHQIGNLNLTYDHARRDDARALAVADVPVHLDTGHAAKTLMDFVFVAPTAPDRNGEIKATTVPAKNYLLDKMPDRIE
jgi:hypothetical protein